LLDLLKEKPDLEDERMKTEGLRESWHLLDCTAQAERRPCCAKKKSQWALPNLLTSGTESNRAEHTHPLPSTISPHTVNIWCPTRTLNPHPRLRLKANTGSFDWLRVDQGILMIHSHQ